MNSIGIGNNGGSGMPVKIIFIILALVALYYLYQFLFTSSGLEGNTVITGIKPANPKSPIILDPNTYPRMLEGGEYSVNMWMYISDWSVRNGRRKHVLTLGGSEFKTLTMYLGAYKNALAVRVHNKATGCTVAESDTTSMTENLCNTVYASIFNEAGMSIDDVTGIRPCDISDIPLQKWIQVTVVLNNTTCDVYMDGKLARSCILKSFFKVDAGSFKASFLENGGFGGYVSKSSFYNYALNPEQIWKLYMSGPSAEYGVYDYIRSLFDPTAVGGFEYPKMNNV